MSWVSKMLGHSEQDSNTLRRSSFYSYKARMLKEIELQQEALWDHSERSVELREATIRLAFYTHELIKHMPNPADTRASQLPYLRELTVNLSMVAVSLSDYESAAMRASLPKPTYRNNFLETLSNLLESSELEFLAYNIRQDMSLRNVHPVIHNSIIYDSFNLQHELSRLNAFKETADEVAANINSFQRLAREIQFRTHLTPRSSTEITNRVEDLVKAYMELTETPMRPDFSSSVTSIAASILQIIENLLDSTEILRELYPEGWRHYVGFFPSGQ